jgi:hypothetical protein
MFLNRFQITRKIIQCKKTDRQMDARMQRSCTWERGRRSPSAGVWCWAFERTFSRNCVFFTLNEADLWNSCWSNFKLKFKYSWSRRMDARMQSSCAWEGGRRTPSAGVRCWAFERTSRRKCFFLVYEADLWNSCWSNFKLKYSYSWSRQMDARMQSSCTWEGGCKSPSAGVWCWTFERTSSRKCFFFFFLMTRREIEPGSD